MTANAQTIVSERPIPNHPYSRDEIEDYVARFFHNHLKNPSRRAEAEKRVLAYMQAIPPWVQILVIENRVPLHIGPASEMKLGRNVMGNATPDTYDVRTLASLLRSPEQEAEFYLSHEIGHSIDNILGRHHAVKPDRLVKGNELYLSEMRPGWIARVSQDRDLRSPRRKANLHYEWQKFLEMYPPDQAPLESFAFIMSHYITEYFRGQDASLLNDPTRTLFPDEDSINEKMEQHFPRIWPYYRQHMLPQALELASAQYWARRDTEAGMHARLEQNMREGLDAVVVAHNCPPYDPKLVSTLANSYYTNWQYLLEVLAQPLPPRTDAKLKLLFPSIFDPVWGAQQQGHGPKKKARTLRSFPELKETAEAFVSDIPDQLKREGIDGFLNNYRTLCSQFEEGVQKQPKRQR